MNTASLFHFFSQGLVFVTQFLSLGWPCDLFFANGTLANVTPQRPEKYLHVLLCSLKKLLRALLPSWEQFQNNLYTWREDQVGSHSSQSLVWNTLSGWPASWQTLEPIHTDQNYLVGSKLIAKLQSCEPQSLVLVISCGAKCSKT